MGRNYCGASCRRASCRRASLDGASFDGASGPGTPVPTRITTSTQARREGKICYKGTRRNLYKTTKVEERIGPIWKKRVGYVKQMRTE
jgi:hypothetical protein